MQNDDPHEDVFTIDAASLERRAMADVIAGAVSHEIAHTLNFLRVLVEDIADGVSPTAEDATIARKEIERLSRLMKNLRSLKLPSTEMTAVSLRDVVLRATAAIRATPGTAQVSVSSSFNADLKLSAEPSRLFILIRDVLAEVVRHMPLSGSVEIGATLPADQSGICLEIWSGDCAHAPAEVDRFAPWNLASGTRFSIGLSIANRIARGFGWTLEAFSDSHRQGVRIFIPAASLCSEHS